MFPLQLTTPSLESGLELTVKTTKLAVVFFSWPVLWGAADGKRVFGERLRRMLWYRRARQRQSPGTGGQSAVKRPIGRGVGKCSEARVPSLGNAGIRSPGRGIGCGRELCVGNESKSTARRHGQVENRSLWSSKDVETDAQAIGADAGGLKRSERSAL